MTNLAELVPDIKISVNQIFGIDTEMKVDGFSKKNEYVPEIDSNYKFDRDTTLAIISGFIFLIIFSLILVKNSIINF